MGWRPILITGLVLDLLRKHFTSPLNIEEPDLRTLVWQESVRTGILIESIHRWRGDLVEKRPAIVVKKNARQNLRIGIEDYVGADELGNVHFETYWLGTHTLFCIHESGAATEILATEVQRELTQFGPLFVKYMGLAKWQVVDVGDTAILEESRQSFVTPVNVAWAYSEKWSIEKEALKLRKVNLDILLDGTLIQRTT